MICKHCGRQIMHRSTDSKHPYEHKVYGWIGCDNEKRNGQGQIGVEAEPEDKEQTIKRLLKRIDE